MSSMKSRKLEAEAARRIASDREDRNGNILMVVAMICFTIVIAIVVFIGANQGTNIHNGLVVSKIDHPAGRAYLPPNVEYWTLDVQHDGRVDVIKVPKSVYDSTQVGSKFSN